MTARHFVLLVEEPSMEAFVRALLPRLLPADRSFEVHAFQGKSDLLDKIEMRLATRQPPCDRGTRGLVFRRLGRGQSRLSAREARYRSATRIPGPGRHRRRHPGGVRERDANVVQNAKFSELLQQSLARYRNRAIGTAQVIEEPIAMAKKFQAAAHRAERLGLNADEIAFYDALAANESSVRELGDETLQKIAVELTVSLRRSVTVDWAKRETVRAKLRVMVRTLLRRYRYPPGRQEDAIATVPSQAESLPAQWASA